MTYDITRCPAKCTCPMCGPLCETCQDRGTIDGREKRGRFTGEEQPCPQWCEAAKELHAP